MLDSDANAANGLLEPVQDVRDYEPPIKQAAEPEPDFDEYEVEVELNDGVNPADISTDAIVESLSTDNLKELIQRTEAGCNPRQHTVMDDVDNLTTAELAVLIGKLGR
jgi:hypothetical protein